MSISIITIIISCFIPLALAVSLPRWLVYYLLYTGALPFGMIFGEAVLTPFGKLNILSLRVLGLIFSCGFVILMNLNNIIPYWRKWILWALFIIWCGLSIFWVDNWIFGLRMFLKLSAPVLFAGAVIAIKPKESDYKIVENAIIWNFIILAAIAVICKVLGIVGAKGELTVPSHGSSVFAAFLMIPVALATSKLTCGQQKNKWFIALFVAIICTVAAYVRTPIAAEAIAIAAILLFLVPAFIGLPLVLSFLVSVMLIFLEFDYFKKRMFIGSDSINVATLINNPDYLISHLDGSGRFHLWDTLLKKFYYPHPIIGSGLGATQSYLIANLEGGNDSTLARVAHSEYIRLICETGLIGIVLFLLASLVTLHFLYQVTKVMPTRYKHIGLTSIGLFIAYLMFCSTDNAFDYVSVLSIYLCSFISLAFYYVSYDIHLESHPPM
jgi:hypothetical protein